MSEPRELGHWPRGVGVAARGCHLPLGEERDGENGATERSQGDLGEGQNVLEEGGRC